MRSSYKLLQTLKKIKWNCKRVRLITCFGCSAKRKNNINKQLALCLYRTFIQGDWLWNLARRRIFSPRTWKKLSKNSTAACWWRVLCRASFTSFTASTTNRHNKNRQYPGCGKRQANGLICLTNFGRTLSHLILQSQEKSCQVAGFAWHFLHTQAGYTVQWYLLHVIFIRQRRPPWSTLAQPAAHFQSWWKLWHCLDDCMVGVLTLISQPCPFPALSLRFPSSPFQVAIALFDTN